MGGQVVSSRTHFGIEASVSETVFGVGLGFSQIPDKLINAKNFGDEVYLIMNQSRLKLSPAEMNKVKIIKEYQKPDNDKLLLIQI